MTHFLLAFILNGFAQSDLAEDDLCSLLRDPSKHLGRDISISGKFVSSFEETFIRIDKCDRGIYVRFSDSLLNRGKGKDKRDDSVRLLYMSQADAFTDFKGLRKWPYAVVSGTLSCGTRSSKVTECSVSEEPLLTITVVKRVWIEVALQK